MSNALMQQFVSGLKSRNPEVRGKASRDLNLYVKTELREVSAEELANFMDEFNHHIFEMVSGSDVNEKKGGILAIVCLIGADVGNINNRISRFANYLRNLLPSNDMGVMELAAKTVGKLALVSGTYSAQYVEFEVKRAFEWLGGDRNEGKRHAAVLVLRELALSVPTYFFQQVQLFFDLIFNAVRDPKPVIREGAVEALRAVLVITSQRETAKQTQKPLWYKQCYDIAFTGFDDLCSREKGVNRDDRVHGSLLVLNELMRCSNAKWEHTYEDLMLRLQCEPTQPSSDSVGIFPRLKSPLSSSKSRQLGAYSYSSYKIGSLPLPNNKTNADHALYESAACRSLITEHFDDICNEVLSQRISRSPHIQHTLFAILPRLAAFNKEKFVLSHLNPSMVYLLTTLRGRERDRATAFTTVGLISVAVEDLIQPYIPKIIEIVRASLPTKETPSKKRGAGLDPTVFVCITLLGHAVKTLIKTDVKELLEPMLATGLSSALTIALRELAMSIPQLKPDISEGLLRMLSHVLMNKQLRHPGMPAHLPAANTSIGLNLESQDIPSIVLALRTLGSFNFDGHSLLQFVRRCAEHFLNSEPQEVRLEAVRTCSRLLRLAVESASSRHSQTVTQTVADVLGKLLVVGITDTDAEVRYWVIASLDESFDQHLAQAENLSALFVAMNDEVFEIRELAVSTIGRLSSLNPAYVMPSLRKTLIQFLTELEHSGMGRNKEQSARMLDHLVVNAPRLIRHYMEPILKVLLPKLKESEPNPGVVISVLTVIGDLAEVNGMEMQKWMGDLLSILLEMLGDASFPEKRGVALWTLGQLVGATGFVVKPYNQYPTLLDTLINFLKTEQQPIIRRETIRVLGLLGALDPYKHKMNLGQIDTQVDSTALLSMTDLKSETEASYG
uniref:Serine/threonine-protein kinase TOR n=1 Tax=Clastoptera arizonana TaxID=38151 RepID=A0A1B6E046_9HEMI